MRKEKIHLPSPSQRLTGGVPRRKVLVVTLIITALGFALRLYALASESLWYDELLQLDIVQGEFASIFPQLSRHAAVPLDYLLTHFWILLGREEAWVRLPAVMFGTLTLPIAYQLGRALLGQSEGLLVMALLAASPFHVRYSQEVRPYALVVLGVSLAAYGLWRFRATGRRRYSTILLLGVLIFSLSHMFALVIFVPFMLFLGTELSFGKNQARAARSMVVVLGAGLVAVTILSTLGYGGGLYYSTREFSKALITPEKFTVEATEKPNQGTGPQVNAFFIRREIVGPLGAGEEAPVMWLFNSLAGLGLLYLLLRKRFELGWLLGLWLVLPVILIVSFLIYRGTFFASRYIISALPAYLILVTVGILALPRWLRCAEPPWLATGAFAFISGLLLLASAAGLVQLYTVQKNEDWRLVSQFLAENSQPEDAIMVVNAESTLNWYYPPARAELDSFDTLAAIEQKVARARRSWVIVNIFSNYLGDEVLKIRAWLGEQGAIRLVFDPVIDIYYLGPNTNPPQLLKEIQGMALPVDSALYASLARENRRDPAVARRYYELAIEHAPTEAARAAYQAALEEFNVEP